MHVSSDDSALAGLSIPLYIRANYPLDVFSNCVTKNEILLLKMTLVNIIPVTQLIIYYAAFSGKMTFDLAPFTTSEIVTDPSFSIKYSFVDAYGNDIPTTGG